MPGSLLSRSRVARHESTRSDRSDASAYSNGSQNSGKKVSFNKSVRVKKYPKAKRSLFGNGDVPGNGGGHMNGLSSEHPSTSPEKRFWFKVYKNKHRQAPDPREFQSDVIYYGPTSNSYDDVSYHPNPSSSIHYTLPQYTSDSGTQTPGKYSGELSSGPPHNEATPLHPSQMPTEPPTVRRNHVRKIVSRFNEEAVLQRQRSPDGERSPPKSPPTSPKTYPVATSQGIPPPPPEPPTAERNTFSRFKKSPIVNGVKVIFGMAPLKKKDKVSPLKEPNPESAHDKKHANGDIRNKSESYKYLRSDDSDLEEGDEGYSTTNRKSKDVATSGETFIVPIEREGEKDSYYFNGYYDDDYYDGDGDENRRNKIHVETWDSGNQLLFDTSDVSAFSEKTDGGEFLKTIGEKHQLWRNNKRIIVYEEPPSPPTKPSRRKAKSQSDLTSHEDRFLSEKSHIDKVKSTEEIVKSDATAQKNKDTLLKQWKTTTKDKGIQCSKVPKGDKILSCDDISSGKYKIIRPRNGVVSAYSHVPSLEKSTNVKNKTVSSQVDAQPNSPSTDRRSGSAIYSQVDKSKKKKNGLKKADYGPGGLFKSRSEPLYIGPPPKNSHQEAETDDFQTSIYYDNTADRKVKTSRRSFGFHLKSNKEHSDERNRATKDDYSEENWYDVDDDVKAVEQQKWRGPDHHDIAEVRQELAEDEEEGLSDDTSSLNNGRRGDVAASVMREVDYKKREISYENIYRPEGDAANHHQDDGVGSGLWHRDADEDYRREMAQSEVSYPAGNHVGSDRFYTLGRSENASKRTVTTPSPRAYTLDRRYHKEKHRKVPNTSGVKILVNGKEVEEKGTLKKSKGHRKGKVNGEDPSSVQSDPMYVRGGLAAAYQARQRAAVRRSNSSITGNAYRSSPTRLSPNLTRRGHASSEASGASSESESTRLRRPLVMYIPGISHPEKSAEEGDRNSSVNVARSQSMMTTARPPRITPKGAGARRSHRSSRHKEEDIFEEEDDEIMPLARESKRKSGHKKQSDIRRRHSMPKDTKFSWLKWRIKGKPSREP